MPEPSTEGAEEFFLASVLLAGPHPPKALPPCTHQALLVRMLHSGLPPAETEIQKS